MVLSFPDISFEKTSKKIKIGKLNNIMSNPSNLIIIISPPAAKISSEIIEQIGRSKFTAAKLLEFISDSFNDSSAWLSLKLETL